MLNLRRKVGQGIWIADNIFVMVAAVDGDDVLIAVEAPRYIPIVRDDVNGRDVHQAFRGEKLFCTRKKPID